MVRSFFSRIGLGCSLALVALVGFAATAADEDPRPKPKSGTEAKKSDDKAADAKKDGEEKKEEDPYVVPKDASPEELVKFLEGHLKGRPRSLDQLKKMMAAIEQSSTAILAAEKVEEEHAVLAVRSKLNALRTLARYGDKDAGDKAKEFLAGLENDKRKGVALVVAEEGLKTKVAEFEDMKPSEREQFLKDVMAHLESVPVNKDALRLAMGVADAIEDEDAKLAAEIYEKFGAHFAKSDDDVVKDYSKKLGGIARRLRLPGNSIEIEGTTLSGEPFDLKKLEGKVVLIDFWATWCGPCIAELPNLKKNYEAYHDKGFEVVGISLDEDKSKLEAFIKSKEIPWLTLFGTNDETRGWEHPMASKYGINGIPTVILVDQKGKVVDLNARGPKLGKLLEKLLGPVEEKPAAETEAAPKK